MGAYGDIVCRYCGAKYYELDEHDCHPADLKAMIDKLLEDGGE